MIIVGLSDIHGHLENLAAIGDDLYAADVVIISGDLTHFGGRDDAQQIINAVAACNQRILAVPGNCDTPQVGDFLAGLQISLDRKCTTIDNIDFVGIGGSLPCPGDTPNEMSEKAFAAALEELACRVEPDKLSVFVTHQPPYGTAADLAGSRHVGSKAARSFIERTEPLLCLCGHIHEARSSDNIGKTRIFNPGPLRQGFYTYAEITDELKLAEIRRMPKFMYRR